MPDRYVTMPTLVRTADKASLDITGPIDVRSRIACTDWTPATSMAIASKYAAGGARSWVVAVHTSGVPLLTLVNDGTTAFFSATVGATPYGFTDGSPGWIRTTFDSATGAIATFKAPDQRAEPSSWTAVASTTTSALALFSGSAQVELGSYSLGAGQPFTGKLYKTTIRNGIDGTVVADFDASIAAGRSSYADAYGNTWLIG